MGSPVTPTDMISPSGPYMRNAVDNTGSFGLPFGLPGIQSDITITGLFGPNATAIIERSLANGTPDFGIFDNRPNTGHRTLNHPPIRDGHQPNNAAATFKTRGP